jgi:hypothetical protein
MAARVARCSICIARKRCASSRVSILAARWAWVSTDAFGFT